MLRQGINQGGRRRFGRGLRAAITGLLGLVLCCLLLLPAAARAEGAVTHDFPQGSLTLEGHRLVKFQSPAGDIDLFDILADPGVDGAFLLNTIGHQRFIDMNTWDLARVVPRAGMPQDQELTDITLSEEGVQITTRVEDMAITRSFTPTQHGLRVAAKVTNLGRHPVEIQGINLQVHGLKATEDTAFRFPGNVPYQVTRLKDIRHFATRQAAYCASIVRVEEGADPCLNLLFYNQEEKWSTALWRDRDYQLQAAFLAMAEGLLPSGASYEVGPLYLQPTARLTDPYAPVRALYEDMGWQVPRDGSSPTGPLYSAHPHGTMDAGFRDRNTMADFAGVLPGLRDMGIESVWILPIFEHTGRGVYEPTEQAIIDPRYGDDRQVRAFVDRAHELSMKVLFDYVPHGPYPTDPLALEHPEWCSIHRSGRQQIEWDCVSFDMANPDYQRYTRDLIQDHVARFDVDGGRIDCAMGGLSNWQPGAGLRPSNSGILGGQQIVTAIREGFLTAGKQPLLLPENFHPLPFYASVTDLFYDMPLYRAMFDMRQDGLSEADFARTLAQWLADEEAAGVPGTQRLRFLGNHDTVSWTWDRARATAVYGLEKAQALWTLFYFIDGVPFLYQGDELSSIYDRRTASDLRPFFTGLFAARARHLDPGMGIQYLPAEGALVAFTRTGAEGGCLALVNLGQEGARFPLPADAGHILYGTGQIEDGQALLGPYESLLIALP